MKEFAFRVARKLSEIVFSTKVAGDTRHFNHERLLIIANHPSFLDGILLGLHLPVRPVFLVHTTVKDRPVLRQFAKMVDTFEVDPTSPYAIKSIVRLLESGRPVVIFPEGRLTVTNGLMKVYPGAAFAAAKTGATIVPVTIDGAEFSKVSRLGDHLPTKLFPNVTLTINDPFKLEPPETGTAREKRLALGEKMRQHLQIALFNKTKPESLYEAFIAAQDVYGSERPMVEDITRPNKPFTYGEIREKIEALRVLYVQRDLKDEQRIGVFMPNSASTVNMVYALNAENKTACMLNYTSGFDSLDHAIKISGIKTLATSKKFIEEGGFAELLQKLLDSNPGLRVHYLEELAPRLDFASKALIAKQSKFASCKPAAPNSEAVVLYTSGSEGKPKGVAHTNESLISNVWQIRSLIDATPKDKVMMCLPLFHSFGMTSGALYPLMSGVPSMLFPSPLKYKVIPELVYDKNCTMLFGTNTFLAHYGKQAHHFDFARVRYVVAGAEKLSDSTRELYHNKFGLRIMEGYGLTETAPVLAVNTPMAHRVGSVGQFVPGVEYVIEKVEGIDEGGALHVRCPNLMKGYIQADQALQEVDGKIEGPVLKSSFAFNRSIDSGPWHKTGDIVDVDQDGFVFIKGRMKRFAKIAGEMISLETSERIALAATGGKECAVVSLPDQNKGEALALFTLDPGIQRSELIRRCKEIGASELAIPRKIHVVDKLPLLGSGKTDYAALNKMAAELAETESQPGPKI